MTEGHSEIELQVWRSFLSANTRLRERLDHELQQRSQLSLTDYDILSALSEAPEARLRMSDLAERVLVSRSRLTYRIDRLAELDYVARQECEDDRRGLFAILTDKGSEALEAAAPGLQADVQNLFYTAFQADEMEVVARVMSRMDEFLSTH
jgi:DNA-binding MarR family transcriptional regulator